MLNLIKIICLFAALILSGCSTIQGYPGPELPKEQIAMVKISDGRIALDHIKSSFGTSISVLPGAHQLFATWKITTESCTAIQGTDCLSKALFGVEFECQLDFTAIAGHSYVADIIDENHGTDFNGGVLIYHY